jgi:hypothetical protein
MTHQQLEEFLVSTELTKSQQDEVREAQDKGRRYQEIFFWHKLHKVKNAIAELQGFIAKNGIFLSFEIESKFSAISNKLWEATTSKQVGHEAEDWKMQRDGWDKIKNEAEPLYEEIKLAIQSRLKSHAHSDL